VAALALEAEGWPSSFPPLFLGPQQSWGLFVEVHELALPLAHVHQPALGQHEELLLPILRHLCSRHAERVE
jgi:hypothetical protein